MNILFSLNVLQSFLLFIYFIVYLKIKINNKINKFYYLFLKLMYF
jgi:hypothetical protein